MLVTIFSGIKIDQLSLRFPSYAEMESTAIMNKLKLVCHYVTEGYIVAYKQQGTVNPILGSQYLLSSVVQKSWGNSTVGSQASSSSLLLSCNASMLLALNLAVQPVHFACGTTSPLSALQLQTQCKLLLGRKPQQQAMCPQVVVQYSAYQVEVFLPAKSACCQRYILRLRKSCLES